MEAEEIYAVPDGTAPAAQAARTCSICGREIPPDGGTEVYDGSVVCEDCLEERFVRCGHCGEFVRSGNALREYHGEPLCDDCFDEHYRECADCGEIITKEEATDVGGRQMYHYVCEACRRDGYFRCDCCGEWHSVDYRNITVDDDEICDDCGCEHYFSCERCGGLCHIDHGHYNGVEGVSYCDSCWERRREGGAVVHSYHWLHDGRGYTPRRCGDEKTNLFLGVELECEKGEFDGDDFQKWIDDDLLIHFEEDGSLDRRSGVELITQPCSLKYHQNKMRWGEIIGNLLAQGFRSHNTDTCGLHVHVSRKALDPSAIVKLDYFINRHKCFFELAARRGSTKYCEYKYKKPDIRTRSRTFGSRYVAVNTTNSDTIEIRIFRGSLVEETVLGTIEFVHALCNYLPNVPFPELVAHNATACGFVSHIGDHADIYPHAMPMLKRLVSNKEPDLAESEMIDEICNKLEKKENKKCA